MGKKSSPPLTEELAAKIKHLLGTQLYNQHEIAALFGVNQGRVSEVNTGKRWPETPPTQPPLPGF